MKKTRAGERLIKSAKQALAFAKGQPGLVVHVPSMKRHKKTISVWAVESADARSACSVAGTSENKICHRSGEREFALSIWQIGPSNFPSAFSFVDAIITKIRPGSQLTANGSRFNNIEDVFIWNYRKKTGLKSTWRRWKATIRFGITYG